MTKLSVALGASLLILSLATPALADQAKPPTAPAKAVSTAPTRAQDLDDHEARRVSKRRDDKAHDEKRERETPDKERRHDRD